MLNCSWVYCGRWNDVGLTNGVASSYAPYLENWNVSKVHRCWWQLDVGDFMSVTISESIGDVGDGNGRNCHHHLKVVSNTFHLPHPSQHWCSQMFHLRMFFVSFKSSPNTRSKEKQLSNENWNKQWCKHYCPPTNNILTTQALLINLINSNKLNNLI